MNSVLRKEREAVTATSRLHLRIANAVQSASGKNLPVVYDGGTPRTNGKRVILNPPPDIEDPDFLGKWIEERATAMHEGCHIRYSRFDLIQPAVGMIRAGAARAGFTYSDRAAFIIMDGLEDIRINRAGMVRFAGAIPWFRAQYARWLIKMIDERIPGASASQLAFIGYIIALFEGEPGLRKVPLPDDMKAALIDCVPFINAARVEPTTRGVIQPSIEVAVRLGPWLSMEEAKGDMGTPMPGLAEPGERNDAEDAPPPEEGDPSSGLGAAGDGSDASSDTGNGTTGDGTADGDAPSGDAGDDDAADGSADDNATKDDADGDDDANDGDSDADADAADRDGDISEGDSPDVSADVDKHAGSLSDRGDADRNEGSGSGSSGADDDDGPAGADASSSDSGDAHGTASSDEDEAGDSSGTPEGSDSEDDAKDSDWAPIRAKATLVVKAQEEAAATETGVGSGKMLEGHAAPSTSTDTSGSDSIIVEVGDERVLRTKEIWQAHLVQAGEYAYLPSGVAKALRPLIERRAEDPHRGLKRGHLDSSSLWKAGAVSKLGDGRLFSRPGLPGFRADLAVLQLRDHSGSMQYQGPEDPAPRHDMVAIASWILAVAFEELQVPLATYSFQSAGGEHRHEEIMGFGSRDTGRCLWASGWGGNADGLHIDVATRDLLARPERKKLLITMTDGLPTDGRNPFEHAVTSVQKARMAGVAVLEVFLGDVDDQMQREQIRIIFGHHVVLCENVKQLPTLLAKGIRLVLKETL